MLTSNLPLTQATHYRPLLDLTCKLDVMGEVARFAFALAARARRFGLWLCERSRCSSSGSQKRATWSVGGRTVAGMHPECLGPGDFPKFTLEGIANYIPPADDKLEGRPSEPASQAE